MDDTITMDALTLLREVSDAYRSLRSLSVEASILTESGDENFSQHSEQRVHFLYAAPDRIRYERFGKNGIVQVADGKELHTSFGGRRFAGKPHYSSVPAANLPRLPHLFQPDFPFGVADEVFLYQGIEQGVVAAQILRHEDGCHVVSVTYKPSPRFGVITGSPVLLWVNGENRIVMRQEGEVGHRRPAEDEITWTRHTVAVRKVSINEPLSENTFHFTPPPDSNQTEAGRFPLVARIQSGFVEHSSDNERPLEHRRSHEWDGDTLVEHSKWKMRGVTLLFERRLTFSADGKELHIAERITGPKGEVTGNHSLPVDSKQPPGRTPLSTGPASMLGPEIPGVLCPKCIWRPRAKNRWRCKCGHQWNTFDTRGLCPGCGYQWEITVCPECGEISPHKDWYLKQ